MDAWFSPWSRRGTYSPSWQDEQATRLTGFENGLIFVRDVKGPAGGSRGRRAAVAGADARAAAGDGGGREECGEAREQRHLLNCFHVSAPQRKWVRAPATAGCAPGMAGFYAMRARGATLLL